MSETPKAPHSDPEVHKNDIYGDIESDSGNPAIPAATVVLLRDIDGDGKPEVLMLRKNSKIAFGGMWVFPGGRIDPEDFPEDRDLETAARNAAAREAQEEAGILVKPDDFVWFAHWSPPPSTARRFATWFFAVEASEDHEIEIDGGEIMEHDWVNPGLAIERHRAGEIDLAPPTWVTLYHLSRYSPSTELLAHLAEREPGVYETHIVKRSDGVRVALWKGDSGYEAWDADLPGERHRLILSKDGFVFEHPANHY